MKNFSEFAKAGEFLFFPTTHPIYIVRIFLRLQRFGLNLPVSMGRFRDNFIVPDERGFFRHMVVRCVVHGGGNTVPSGLCSPLLSRFLYPYDVGFVLWPYPDSPRRSDDITKCGLWSLLGSQTYQYDQVLAAHPGVRDYVTQRRGRLCAILTHVTTTPYRHRPLKGRDKRSKNQKETTCGAGLRPHRKLHRQVASNPRSVCLETTPKSVSPTD